MRTNKTQDDFIEDYEPGPMPPMTAETAAAERRVTPLPPRLCEAGPCVHYHRFDIQLDAEGPRAESISPGGQMSGLAPKQPFYVRVHHFCYPTVGVETDLGGLPVLKCNLWQPITDETVLERARSRFLESDAGKAYTAELAAWTDARAKDSAAAELEDELGTWITMNVRDGDEVDVFRCFEDTEARVQGNTDADTARAFLTIAYLRETYGTGSFRVSIARTTPEGPGEITTRKVEVL